MEIRGTVTGSVYWSGTHGRYKKLSGFTFEAAVGSLIDGVDVTAGVSIPGWLAQSRTIRTPELNPTPQSPCSSCGIESDRGDHIDTGFSLLIVWSGRAAVRSYRIFADPEQEKSVGNCDVDESGEENIVIDAQCPPLE